MKRVILIAAIFLLTATGWFIAAYEFSYIQDQQTAHHRYVREQEIQMHDLKTRLRVLEEIGIEVTVVGPAYAVAGVEIQ